MQQSVEYWAPRLATGKISENFENMQCLDTKDVFLKGHLELDAIFGGIKSCNQELTTDCADAEEVEIYFRENFH